jgi:predicted DNA-binding transcriptional regulator AlpA
MGERTYLTDRQTAEMLGYSQRTLINMRSKKTDPPFIKHGARVWYDLADIYAWLDAAKVQTSTPAGDILSDFRAVHALP